MSIGFVTKTTKKTLPFGLTSQQSRKIETGITIQDGELRKIVAPQCSV
jgi:hypothetical protein